MKSKALKAIKYYLDKGFNIIPLVPNEKNFQPICTKAFWWNSMYKSIDIYSQYQAYAILYDDKFFCLDIDIKDGLMPQEEVKKNLQAYEKFKELFGRISTMRIKTKSNGYHLWFTHTEKSRQLLNSDCTNMIYKPTGELVHFDIKRQTYAIGPYSKHELGQYMPETPIDTPIAQIPDEFFNYYMPCKTSAQKAVQNPEYNMTETIYINWLEYSSKCSDMFTADVHKDDQKKLLQLTSCIKTFRLSNYDEWFKYCILLKECGFTIDAIAFISRKNQAYANDLTISANIRNFNAHYNKKKINMLVPIYIQDKYGDYLESEEIYFIENHRKIFNAVAANENNNNHIVSTFIKKFYDKMLYVYTRHGQEYIFMKNKCTINGVTETSFSIYKSMKSLCESDAYNCPIALYVKQTKGYKMKRLKTLDIYSSFAEYNIIHDVGLYPENYNGQSLNLFGGFEYQNNPNGIDPDKFSNDINLIDYHLQNIICNGDQRTYDYCRQWFSNIFHLKQNKTSIILKSTRGGSGKNLFVQLLMRAIGQQYCYDTHSIKNITEFNKTAMHNKILVCCNEFETNIKAIQNTMKSLITSDDIVIEEKFQTRFTSRNYTNIVLTSNEEKPLGLSIGDRRYLILDVSTERVNDFEYFSDLANVDGYSVYRYFSDIDTSSFNPQDIPLTDAKQEIQELSYDDMDRFAYNCIETNDQRQYSLTELKNIIPQLQTYSDKKVSQMISRYFNKKRNRSGRYYVFNAPKAKRYLNIN